MLSSDLYHMIPLILYIKIARCDSFLITKPTHWSRNPEVVGSNPTGSKKLIFQNLFIFYHIHF